MSMKMLSIIVVTCNGLDYTRQCIEVASFYARQRAHEIIVIDNGSHDGTAEWLQMQNNVKVIISPVNRGAAWAYNQGVAAAEGDMLLLLHNDVVLTKKAIDEMEMALYASPQIGAVAPLSNRTYFGLQTVQAAEYNDFKSMQEFADKIAMSEIQNHQAMLLENFCLLVKREAIQAAGGFSEEYTYHYYEDLDFSLRIIQAGYRLKLLENLYVHHEKGSFLLNGWNREHIVNENEKRFFKIWGIHPEYSTNMQEAFLKLINYNIPDLQILEIGCACGGTLMRIQEQNPLAELTGIEFNKYAAKIAAQFAEVLAMDVESLEKPEWNKKYHYILLGDVLEHLQNPEAALKNLYNFLRSDGKVIISIPNVQHISIIEQLLQGNWEYQDAGILDRTHVRFFTKKAIMAMLIRIGFKIEYMAYRQVEETDSQRELKKAFVEMNVIPIDIEGLSAYQWYVLAGK